MGASAAAGIFCSCCRRKYPADSGRRSAV